jgi:hypothetical protein
MMTRVWKNECLCVVIFLLILRCFLTQLHLMRNAVFVVPIGVDGEIHNLIKRYKCLAYSVFGNDSFYTNGLLKTVRDSRIIYHDWIIKVFHSDGLANYHINYLRNTSGVILVNMNDAMPSWISRYVNPMSWRFLVAADLNVSYFAIRDGDSRPSWREKLAVDEWIKSGQHFHTMHDHPLHNPEIIPIFGGMWGGISGYIPNFTILMKQHYEEFNWSSNKPFPYNEDQEFLRKYVFPVINGSCLKHDSYYCHKSGGIGFPIKRQESKDKYDFVGNSFNKVSSLNQSLYREDRMLFSKRYRKSYNLCLIKRKDIG